MKLFHTSPESQITPKSTGTFDEFIFFSESVYAMTAGEYHVFNSEVDESGIIEARRLWHQENWKDAMPFINELASRLGIEDGDAMALLDETLSIYDIDIGIKPEDMADESWNIQRLTARCAKAMGFIGVQVEDEQGAAYMIDATAIEITKAD